VQLRLLLLRQRVVMTAQKEAFFLWCSEVLLRPCCI
jgi:hypothetical protein